MTTMNGSTAAAPRKSLADQIDRLESILDGLSEALAGAVADAVKESVGNAVRSAVREALGELTVNGGGNTTVADGHVRGRPDQPARSRHRTSALAVWWDMTAVWCRTRFESAWRSAAEGLKAVMDVAWSLRRPLLVAAPVALLLALAVHAGGPVVAVVLCAFLGFFATVLLALVAAVWWTVPDVDRVRRREANGDARNDILPIVRR